MIDINLIPPDLKKKRKKTAIPALNIPREAIVGLVGGLFVLLLGVHLLLQIVIFMKYVQHSKYKKQWEEIAPDKQKADVVKNELRALQSRLKAIQGITSEESIALAPKLNAISDGLPREVWLSKISFDDKILLVAGSAVSKLKSEMISVGDFVSNLKKEDLFMEGLSDIELSSIQRRKVKTVEIVDFLLQAKIKK